jgi:hypothetical protein
MNTTQFIAGNYHIESYGNGSAYSITDQRTGQNIWAQGDDANTLRDDTNDWEHTEILEEYFDCMCD